MPTFETGTSNYPNDFDLIPTTGTATLEYVLDQIRDPSTGIISQSGTQIISLALNTVYTILQEIEETIGLNPQGIYSDVTDRLDWMQQSGTFGAVLRSGDSMFGDLTMTGSTIFVDSLSSTGLSWILSGNSNLLTSGTFNITNEGGPIELFATNNNNIDLSGNTISISYQNAVISGLGTLLIGAESGTTFFNSIYAAGSGTQDIGSASNPFGTIYADQVVSTGIASDYVNVAGGTFSGNVIFGSGLTLATGSSILLAESGTASIGSLTSPLLDIYAKTVFASVISGMSPVRFDSEVEFTQNILPESGSSLNIGSPTQVLNAIYVDNIIGTGLDTSTFVRTDGSLPITGTTTFTGSSVNVTLGGEATLVLDSGSHITNLESGVNNAGSLANPFGQVYTDEINEKALANFAFNEFLSGTTDGANTTFTFSNTPINGYANVFVSGILMTTYQYGITGNTLTFTGTGFAPTTSPIAAFYLY